MTAPDNSVTATELADTLRCSVETIYRMARRGQIPTIRIGREYRFFTEEVKARLSAKPAPFTQSRRSTARRRAA